MTNFAAQADEMLPERFFVHTPLALEVGGHKY
jgi:hypothetical protein